MSDANTLPDGRSIDSLKVVELKKELEVLGLDKNGLKKELVKRLSEALSDSSHNNSTVDENEDMSSNNNTAMEQSTSLTEDKSRAEEHILSVEIMHSKKSSDIDPSDSLTKAPIIEGESEAASSQAVSSHLTENVQKTPSEFDGSKIETSISKEGDVVECSKTSEAESEVFYSVGEPEIESKSKVDNKELDEPSLQEVDASKAVEFSVQGDQRPHTSEVTGTSFLQNSASGNDKEDSSVLPVQTDSTVDNLRTVVLPPPSTTHKLFVELQEEEEDYGSGEEISSDSHPQMEVRKTPKKPASQKDTGLNGGKTSPIKKASVELPKKETRVVGVTIEDPVRVNPVKDAKCPVSNLVYIRYLVRPFTQTSLRSMLEKNFGTSTELWLDRIKSSAMVRFVDQETAVKCREGLDGCRWPPVNPRVLQCEFGTEVLFSWLKENEEAGDKLPPKYLLDPSFAGSGDNSARPGLDGPQERKRQSADQKRDVSNERASKRKREDPKNEEPIKNLDDLFKKTEASPMIYWLPLSDDAAAAQLKSRQDKFLAEKMRRPLSKRDPEEKKRENRSPFMGEFNIRQQSSRLPPSDLASREKRARENSPSPARNRSRFPNEKRRSPPTPPRRGRYGNRTPSPRMAALPSRRPMSPFSRNRRRSPLRR